MGHCSTTINEGRRGRDKTLHALSGRVHAVEGHLKIGIVSWHCNAVDLQRVQDVSGRCSLIQRTPTTGCAQI